MIQRFNAVEAPIHGTQADASIYGNHLEDEQAAIRDDF
jgi:hypothetical protein